ncbi:tRNA pseudouridine(13) synthase TruD [Thalassotalea sp. G2M2-11]|uniref:tRNA pseudouridine(13) synthase TruD n=1 Tax=Thalassotalea sp. G2M2-11 TaxID=2787627 RepID=UPI0019D1B411|nr:tRNA pseudouridine(13) synthase TruD [Thalassotalea sp. G2M2-11]
MLASFAYLYGNPQSQGDLRTQFADFKVIEQLPFTPHGEGEHLLVKIRKTDQNTTYVARQLAKFFAVKDSLVSYAGLKDRFAVTEQWFGIHLPGKNIDDLTDFSLQGVEVLASTRHNKKLRIGALSGNRFIITLRNVSDIGDVQRRWLAITQHGVPNYFGEQRFGRDGGNIDKALAMFAGQKFKDKKKRSIYLSAARSLVFNQVISSRIAQDKFEQLHIGDVMMLSGTQSVFPLTEVDDTMLQRFQSKDVDITAPMWGKGELMTAGLPLQLEQAIAEQYPEICQGLVKFGLKQERRRIRLSVQDSSIEVDKTNQTVQVGFTLPAGCFATSILRELIDYQDVSLTRFE